MLIGLELPAVVAGLQTDGIPLRTAIGYGVLVTIILIAARIISSYAARLTTLIFRPSVAPIRSNRQRMWRLPLLLGWTGMRGVVSLAAALAIPLVLKSNSLPFPHRNLILFITFMVILLTLLIQGLTLPHFIKRSKLFENSEELPEEEAKLKVRNGLAVHTLRLLKTKHEQGDFKDPHLQKMIEQWEFKISLPENMKLSEANKQNYLELLENQRKYLTELNKDPALNEEIIRWQTYQIDLEEDRIKLF